MKRRSLEISIALFWLLMTGLLWHSQADRTNPVGQSLDAQIAEPTENWLALYAGDVTDTETRRKVGYVHLQQIPETRGPLAGLANHLTTHLELELFGRATELDLTGQSWQPFDQDFANFEFAVRSGEFDFQIEGRVAAGQLNGQVRTAGETLPLSFPVEAELFFGGGAASTYRFPNLNVGETVEIASFDPLTLKKGSATVRCVARQRLFLGASVGSTSDETSAAIDTRVLQIDTGGFETKAWIDEQGEIVRASTPLGLTLERTTPEIALRSSDDPGAAGTTLLDLSAIKVEGVRPQRGLDYLELLANNLPGTAGNQLPLPSDAFQQATALEPSDPTRARVIRSRHATFEDTISPGQRRALLSGDAFLQVEHPDIVAQARVIVSGLEAPTDKANALHDWVYSELIKSPALSIPSALEVLQNRRGDCNEHTVLYTALARAAGLPTRIAIGLVWSDDLDGFYYHAWPEVLIEEVEDGVAAGADSNDGDSHWIALDPTLGQRRADATHLKLLEGGIETWTRLLPFLGSLELEVVSTSEPSAPQARTTRGSSP